MNKNIRKAVIEDLPGVMKCIEDARKFLKQSGSTQWNGPEGYPRVTDLVNDIHLSRLYVCEVNGVIAGIAAFLGEEPEYKNPQGKWLIDTNNYLTIHRIAVNADYRGTGIAKSLFSYACCVAKEKNKDSVRVDTHEKNKVMQNIAKDMGFSNCGYVIYSRIQKEPKRLIYEKKI